MISSDLKKTRMIGNNSMTEYEALLTFNKQKVNMDMINFLSHLTESIIKKIRPRSNFKLHYIPSLTEFITNLVNNSRVSTPILMSTTVYLTRLQKILPDNVVGIETTRHRLFLGCLIIAAKTLNDNSPMNKHWSKHSNGLLNNKEINTVERELLSYLQWDVVFSTNELISCLREKFLIPIRFNNYRNIHHSNNFYFTNNNNTNININNNNNNKKKKKKIYQHNYKDSTNLLLYNTPTMTDEDMMNILRPPKYVKSHTMSVDSIPSLTSRHSDDSIMSHNNMSNNINNSYISPNQSINTSFENDMLMTKPTMIKNNQPQYNMKNPYNNEFQKHNISSVQNTTMTHHDHNLVHKLGKTNWGNIFHIK